MMNRSTFLIKINKILKIFRNEGAVAALNKIGSVGWKKLSGFSSEKVRSRRDRLFITFKPEIILNNIEDIFSSGLLRHVEELKSDLKKIPRAASKKIVKEAQAILNNEFTIYGHLKCMYNAGRFSWWRDPLTDFEWPGIITYSQIMAGKPCGTDIKNVWEVGRFQFLSPLAQAYVLTGEKQYAQFAMEKVNSWIDANHFLIGPHWKLPMEASIRLLNWCVYLPLLDVLKHTDHTFKQRIATSILEHLFYIRENLDNSPSGAGNHYFADLVGLLLARLLFPSLPWAVNTSRFAEGEFEREVQRQFTTGGMNFEGSMPYHRLCSEMLLVGAALIKKSCRDISSKVIERIREVYDFTACYTGLCDDCTIIGDNDSGIFLKFFIGQEFNQHRYLNCLFDSILDGRAAPDNWESFLCAVHFTPPDYSNITGARKPDEDRSKELQVKDFNGLVIAKCKTEALLFNTLHSSEGHTHNDKLSLYPVIGRKPLFIDRGSFSYTGFIDKRHEDRISFSHNGPVINGWEQNSIWKDDLFYINGEASCSNHLKSSGNIISITGCHYGYHRYSPGMKVLRQVDWNVEKRTIRITDWVEAKNNREVTFTWNFLFNPEWTGVLENKALTLTLKEMIVCFESMNALEFTLTQSFFSPNYQAEYPCQALRTSWKALPGEKNLFVLRY